MSISEQKVKKHFFVEPEDMLEILKTLTHKKVSKHLAGQHDQSTHGSWAGGAGQDITAKVSKLLKNVFKKGDKEFQEIGYNFSLELQKQITDMEKWDKSHGVGTDYQDYLLRIVAERQGFTKKPQTMDLHDFAQLREKGYTIVFRGITDAYDYDGNLIATAEQIYEQFKNGNYYAGTGDFGDGTYVTDNAELAKAYATNSEDGGDGQAKGLVIAMAIPPTYVTLSKPELSALTKTAKKNQLQELKDSSKIWAGSTDVGILATAKGIQFYTTKTPEGAEGSKCYNILDRSGLIVLDTPYMQTNSDGKMTIVSKNNAINFDQIVLQSRKRAKEFKSAKGKKAIELFDEIWQPLWDNLADVSKHYLGQHDQSTHGNWAHGTVNDFADTKTFKNAVKKLAITYANMMTTDCHLRGGSYLEKKMIEILHKDKFANSTLGKELQKQVKEIYPNAVFLKTGGIHDNTFQGLLNPAFTTNKDYPVIMYEAMLHRLSDEIIKQGTFRQFDASELLYQSFIADDLKAMQTDGKVCIAMDEDSFSQLLSSDDQRFKTQFETKKSNGAYSQDGRRAGELRSQSMPLNEPNSKRPIYGYVAESDDHDAILINGPEQYGGVRVVFKDDVKTRTTMTVGDSLSTGCVPISMTQKEITSFDAWRATDRIVYNIAENEGWNNDSYDIGFLNEGNYFEAQIHDGVKLSDVEAVYIPTDSFADISPLVPKGIRVIEY